MLGPQRRRLPRLLAREARKKEHLLPVDVTQDARLELVPLPLRKLRVAGQHEVPEALQARLELGVIKPEARARLQERRAGREGAARRAMRRTVDRPNRRCHQVAHGGFPCNLLCPRACSDLSTRCARAHDGHPMEDGGEHAQCLRIRASGAPRAALGSCRSCSHGAFPPHAERVERSVRAPVDGAEAHAPPPLARRHDTGVLGPIMRFAAPIGPHRHLRPVGSLMGLWLRGRSLPLLVAAAAVSCQHAGPPAEHDAGRAASAAARPAHARTSARGEYPLDLATSRLSIGVVKDRDTSAPVVATLLLRDGGVTLGGAPATARLSVDLDSYDSAIPLRNERVRGVFFETSAVGWETAEFAIPLVPPQMIQALREKRVASHVMLDGDLRIHGQTVPMQLVVDAGYSSDSRLWVKTATPAHVKISDFHLTDNLHRLSALCMHDSIDDTVEVTAALEFVTK